MTGRLLRVRAAAVAPIAEPVGSTRELGGYVLLLSDVTAEVDLEARRITLFHGFIEASRAALASIRAAIENLIEHPDLDLARRTRFAHVIRDEAVRLSDRVHAITGDASAGLTAQWPVRRNARRGSADAGPPAGSSVASASQRGSAPSTLCGCASTASRSRRHSRTSRSASRTNSVCASSPSGSRPRPGMRSSTRCGRDRRCHRKPRLHG
jgi:hypothetical protein